MVFWKYPSTISRSLQTSRQRLRGPQMSYRTAPHRRLHPSMRHRLGVSWICHLSSDHAASGILCRAPWFRRLRHGQFYAHGFCSADGERGRGRRTSCANEIPELWVPVPANLGRPLAGGRGLSLSDSWDDSRDRRRDILVDSVVEVFGVFILGRVRFWVEFVFGWGCGGCLPADFNLTLPFGY